MALGGRPEGPSLLQRPKVVVGSAGDVSHNLLSLCLEETVNRPVRCSLDLIDWGERGGEPGYLYSEEAAVDFGVGIEVSLPAADGSQLAAFAGKLYGMGRRQPASQPPSLALEAFDRLQELAMVRRSRQFVDTALGTVLDTLAGEYGLAGDIAIDASAVPLMVQANESDLDFLVRHLEELDGELWVESTVLRAALHGDRSGATITLRPGRDLFSLSIDAGLSGQRVATTVTGWNPDSLQDIEASAGASSLAGELDGMVGGGELLGLLATAGPAAEQHVVHRLPRSVEAAQNLARSRYARLARDFVVLRAEARGRAEMRVGARLRLEGSGLRFNGDYFVAQVRHRFDAEQGYRCDLLAKRSGIER